jgi:hypothetical protein
MGAFTRVNSTLVSASRGIVPEKLIPEIAYLEQAQGSIDHVLTAIEKHHANIEREYETIPQWLVLLRNQAPFLGSPGDLEIDSEADLPAVSERSVAARELFDQFHRQINEQETSTSGRLLHQYMSVLSELTTRNAVLRSVTAQLDRAEADVNSGRKAKLRMRIELERLRLYKCNATVAGYKGIYRCKPIYTGIISFIPV